MTKGKYPGKLRLRIAEAALLAGALLLPATHAAPADGKQQKKIAVSVQVTIPDLLVLKGPTVFHLGRGEQKVTLSDFDFRAAFTDELLSSINLKKAYSAHLASDGEGIDFESLWGGGTLQADHLDGEFVMLVRVEQYTVWTKVGLGASDRFFLQGESRIYNRTGKKIWSWKTRPPVDEINSSMTGGFYVKSTAKTDQLFEDNQRAAKDGVNRIIEKWCREVANSTADKGF